MDRSAALVEIRRSERARRWRLELTPRGALLTVPWRTPVREVERIVEANLDWVERRLAERRPVLGLDGVCVTERAARALVRRRGGAIAAQEAGALGVSFARLQVRGQRRAGARAPRPARSRSTGGSRLRRRRHSTTSSSTRSATSASRATAGASGRSSRAGVPGTATTVTGSADTGTSCSPMSRSRSRTRSGSWSRSAVAGGEPLGSPRSPLPPVRFADGRYAPE